MTTLIEGVSRETRVLLDRYVELLLEENQKQNLISRSSEDDVWRRHVEDALQLERQFRAEDRTLVDIGTGPGLPGLILAITSARRVTLVEPRALRTAFLQRVVEELGLAERVRIIEGKADAVEGTFDLITGRAVAPVGRFLALSHHLSTEKTRWILPKGRRVAIELEEARQVWQIDCSVVPSTTGGDGQILVIDRAERRRRG